MTKSRKPKYVKTFHDRHGRMRHYFAPGRGAKHVALPGSPYSTEFMDAYDAALSAWVSSKPPKTADISRITPGTMEDLIFRYYQSSEFKNLRPITQKTYRNLLEGIRSDYGRMQVATLKRKHVESILSKRSEKPEAANGLRKMFKILMGLAVRLEYREDDPTTGVKKIRNTSKGYVSWEEKDIEAYYSFHAEGSKARLAMDLLLYTGLRRGDIVRLGRQHLRDGLFSIQQSKTGLEVSIPLHPYLAQTIDRLPTDNLTFLLTVGGKPFTPAGFGNWFRCRVDEVGLNAGRERGQKGLSAHGLRKAVLRRLAEAGCSAHEIIAISGHKNISEVMRYTAEADRKKLGQAAIATLKAPGNAVET